MKKRILSLFLLAALCCALLAACGGQNGAASDGQDSTFGPVDLAEFYQSIMDAAAEAPAMVELTGEMLDGLYPGLSDLELKQCVVYSPAISAVAMEFAFVEVADSADVEAVQEIFQERIDAQIDGGAFYPATVEAWQNDAEIVVLDNYVCLFVCAEKDGMIAALRDGTPVPAWGDASEPSEEPDSSPEPSDAPSEEPEASPDPSDEPSEEPSAAPSPTPAPTPTPTPTPTPEPSPEPAGVDLTAFAQSVLDSYEFGFLQLADPADETGATLLDNYYAGLTDLGLKQTVVYLCTMTLNNGEFALVEAPDADSAAAAADIFQERIDQMVQGGAWYPEPTRLWSECSRVEVNGNYVMMVVHEQCDDIVELFNDLF